MRKMIYGIASVSGVDRKFRLARSWSNRELRRLAPLFSGAVVNVSAGTDEDKQGTFYADYFSAATSYDLTNYSPGVFRGFEGRPNEHLLDLEAVVADELRQRYDVAFNHTTLEHVFDVTRAFANLCAVTRDILILVVPFAQVQHENDGYRDYWRFTPTCIRRLFQENGLTVIYESANNDCNAATYLLFVASRRPERWIERMPVYQPLQRVGDWIGARLCRPSTLWVRLRGLLRFKGR